MGKRINEMSGMEIGAAFHDIPQPVIVSDKKWEFELPNGRKYRVTDQGEYIDGEYPSGGYNIAGWEPTFKEGKGMWVFISNAPDVSCLMNFLKSCTRLVRLEDRPEVQPTCVCTNPEPYHPTGVCAPMMPIGYCICCGKPVEAHNYSI